MSPEQPLQIYRWSSYPWYWLERSRRPVWLRVDQLWGEWGIRKDSPAGRAEFVYEMGGNFLGPCEGGGGSRKQKTEMLGEMPNCNACRLRIE